jgi:hypothetical protein
MYLRDYAVNFARRSALDGLPLSVPTFEGRTWDNGLLGIFKRSGKLSELGWVFT